MKNKIKFQMKNISKYLLSILIPMLVVSGLAYAASNLTPPGSVSSQSYTLSDIYTKLTTNATTTAGSHSVSTSTIPAGTFKTLTEIYNAIPLIDATKVATGTNYLGVKGTANAYPASPLKTGQIHCNANSNNYGSSGQVICTGTNKDGDYQKGIARSYTDNGDGTVNDNSTGLMWQKCSNGQTGSDCSGGTATTTLFDDGNGVSPTVNYCENLILANYSDWRVPNINELQSLVDYNQVTPPINQNYFPNTQTNYYWSSTGREGNSNSMWIVDFGNGFGGGSISPSNMNSHNYTRCVRGI